MKFWKNLILNCTKAKWGLTLVEEKRFEISCRSSEACLVVKGKFSYHLLSYGNIKLSMKTNVFHIALVFLKGLEVLRHYEHKIDYIQKCEKDEHVHFWVQNVWKLSVDLSLKVSGIIVHKIERNIFLSI